MNIAIHRRVLLSLLKGIYTHPDLAPHLGFKGGTSLYFLHELPRFSVDLDFNIMSPSAIFVPDIMERILHTELTIRDAYNKENTWFWNGVYEPGQWNIKIEISKRIFDDEYEHKQLYGLSLYALTLPCQLSHKLCAITNRSSLQNRDLFDAYFLLKRHTSIVDDIIQKRTEKSTKEYLQDIIDYIPKHISKRGLLDGLGELLDTEMKQWVQEHLREELLYLLRSRLDE